MKNLFKINLTAIVITILLYITFWGGILAQIGLGALQIVCSGIILFYIKNLTQRLQWMFLVYGFLTISLLGYSFMAYNPLMILWTLSAIMALYFLFITYQIQKTWS